MSFGHQAVEPDELLPDNVVLVTGIPGDEYAPLMAPEKACVRNAVDKRVREFTAGRACARRALARLGVRGHALVSGPDRAPVWPEGIVGSITHCRGFVAAAVARREGMRGLGIDAEPAEGVEEELIPLVCTPDERAWLGGREAAWSKAVFSAKEALFKCLHPVTGGWIDFLDVSLEVDAAAGRFAVRPEADVPAEATSVAGRLVRTPTHWLTSAVLE